MFPLFVEKHNVEIWYDFQCYSRTYCQHFDELPHTVGPGLYFDMTLTTRAP